MTELRSPATNKRYTLTQICRVWRLTRSRFYAAHKIKPKRRGPQGAGSDELLIDKIKEAITQSEFSGEGYRKVWARLRFKGLRTAKERVRRLMKLAQLQAPRPALRQHGDQAHSGTICTTQPDMMWGTDATSVLTREGNATIFIMVDHCTQECLGLHAARHGTRFEALEVVRQAVKHSFGAFKERVAKGLAIRHDHGSQFISDAYQKELKFLGITSTPSFVAEPQCNGVSERFIRTLKEQLLWLKHFASVEELNKALSSFKERYNQTWLVAKHNYLTPSEVRSKLSTPHLSPQKGVAS
jgi:putative transposase